MPSVFANFAIGITYSYLQHDRRKEAGSCLSKRISANLLPATFLCIGHTFQGMDFNKTIFQYFSLLVFSFLGGGSKSRIVCRRRSLSYSGGDKSLTRLPPTPPTCLTKPQEKYTPAIAASPKGRLHTFPLPSLSSIGGFYMPASLRFLLSDCMACNQIFYFFIRICLFSVYLHFDAVSTVSHPLVVPVQAQR